MPEDLPIAGDSRGLGCNGRFFRAQAGAVAGLVGLGFDRTTSTLSYWGIGVWGGLADGVRIETGGLGETYRRWVRWPGIEARRSDVRGRT